MARAAEFNVGASPVPEIAAGAARYRQMNGFLAPEQDYSRSVIPPSQTRAVGNAYMAMPSFDARALPAYHAMREEVGRQFDHMTAPRSKGGMGIDVSVHAEDPYGTGNNWQRVMPELREDVVNNSHIGVLSTASTGGHPVFTNDQNDMFRAVHDMFGHLGSGRGVDRHGEDAAYQKHAAMFSPLARGALASETRGQQGALHNTGEFQEQKVGLLPVHFTLPRNLQPLQFGEMPGAREQARGMNRAQEL